MCSSRLPPSCSKRNDGSTWRRQARLICFMHIRVAMTTRSSVHVRNDGTLNSSSACVGSRSGARSILSTSCAIYHIASCISALDNCLNRLTTSFAPATTAKCWLSCSRLTRATHFESHSCTASQLFADLVAASALA